MGTQQQFTIAQNYADPEQTSIALSNMVFASSIGTTMSLTILQVIFINRFSAFLENDSIKNPSSILTTGATDVRMQFKGKLLELVISAYSSALSQMFYFPLSLCLCMVGLAAGIRWKALKQD